MNTPTEAKSLRAAPIAEPPASAISPVAEATAAEGAMGRALPHESAHLHVSGTAAYTDDLPELSGTLHAALGLSTAARGRLLRVDRAALSLQPGVVDILLAADIPGRNECGPIVHDEPILADLAVQYVGQPVFAVIATSRELARRAAAQARTCMHIEAQAAVLDARDAHAAGQYVVPPMHMVRGDAPAALDHAPHRIQGQFTLGGQEQFYLEGQIAYAVPLEDDGMRVYCSTQHPTEMQHVVAHALGVGAHRVQVECRRMGGGFGGKESQSAVFACIAAVAARKTGRPVKLRPDRDDDMLITGRRHGFYTTWDIGFDSNGRIGAIRADLVANAGCTADLSPPVMTRALCHVDNAYFLPHVELHGFCARTNTQSNTAFRGFGGPQGALAIEIAIDDIARKLGKDPLEVRQVNFYAAHTGQGRDVTPYGQVVEDNLIHDLVAQLASQARYVERRAEVAAFNRTSPVLRKGLALTPVKFGISFNVAHFNQAGALVHVYTDGTVLVNHGGTEMGQGLHTKVIQVVAQTLGITIDRVRVTATDTAKVPNTSATAASTGTDLNGKAAEAAALQIRQRLDAFAQQHFAAMASATEAADAAVAGDTAMAAEAVALSLRPEAAALPRFASTDLRPVNVPCPAPPQRAAGMNPPGPARAETVRFHEGLVSLGGQSITFGALVAAAYLARVQLWSDGHYTTPGLHWDRMRLQGRPFFYFAYGAALSEVLVDTLTGENRVVRADLLHDVGRSLNPALDLGQVEGAYIQGLGWLTTEELWWHPESGKLMTHAPATYKIPTANDCPPEFNVALYDNVNPADSIHRSKAVGEPPLLLAFSAFLAIRDAVSSVGDHRVNPPLRAPATPEAVLEALDAVRADS